jgi:hypothetical protein
MISFVASRNEKQCELIFKNRATANVCREPEQANVIYDIIYLMDMTF